MLAFFPPSAFHEVDPLFVPTSAFQELQSTDYSFGRFDSHPYSAYEHPISYLDGLFEAELFEEQRRRDAIRLQREQRARQLRIVEEHKRRQLAALRAEQERRRQLLLHHQREQRQRALQALVSDFQHQVLASRQQEAEAQARAQAVRTAEQRRRCQVLQREQYRRVLEREAAQHERRGSLRNPHQLDCALQQCISVAAPSHKDNKGDDVPKRVHFAEDDVLDWFFDLLSSAAPLAQAQTSSVAPSRSTPVPATQPATHTGDVKGKGKAKVALEPEVDTQPPSQSSAADNVSVGDLLQGRLQTESDQEVIDTLQALMASLQPESTQPTSSSSSQQPVASTSTSTLKLPTRPTPVPAPEVMDRRRSLESIQALARTFHRVAEGFSFPSYLDFAPSRSASPDRPATPRSPSSLAFTSNNAPLHQYEHALGKLLVQLDEIESNGDEEVRARRKELAREVEEALEAMDRMVEAQRLESEPKAMPDDISAKGVPKDAEPALVSDSNTSEPVVNLAQGPLDCTSQVAEQVAPTPVNTTTESSGTLPAIHPTMPLLPVADTAVPEPSAKSVVTQDSVPQISEHVPSSDRINTPDGTEAAVPINAANIANARPVVDTSVDHASVEGTPAAPGVDVSYFTSADDTNAPNATANSSHTSPTTHFELSTDPILDARSVAPTVTTREPDNLVFSASNVQPTSQVVSDSEPRLSDVSSESDFELESVASAPMNDLPTLSNSSPTVAEEFSEGDAVLVDETHLGEDWSEVHA